MTDIKGPTFLILSSVCLTYESGKGNVDKFLPSSGKEEKKPIVTPFFLCEDPLKYVFTGAVYVTNLLRVCLCLLSETIYRLSREPCEK